jgi:formylglycine-generating enzyme required for sulfatase activity
VALVIGNGSYGHHAGLPNVPNDATAMAALFKAANFDSVDYRTNLGVAELRRALREFTALVADADVAVMFYAGHGLEVDRLNYLIPVDARLATDLDVEDETVSLDRVLQFLEPAKRLRLVILDACRENPFLKSMKRTATTRSVGRGLGRVEPRTPNTMVAFAAREGALAEDGKGANSPFTAALVKHLSTPGLDLRLAFGRIRDEVLRSTASRQEPYMYGSLGEGLVSIAGMPPATPTPVVAQPAVPQPAEAAERAWAAAKDTTSIAVLEAFRRQYGAANAFYDRLAEARIDDLKRQQFALLKAEEDRKRAEEERRRAEEEKRAEAELRPGRAFRDCPACPEMVVVPAGSFMMGSEGSGGYEYPRHRVTFARPLAVGKFEVTFAEWDACVTERGCTHSPGDEGWGRGKQPVMNVSWNDITHQYLPWLSRKTGKSYRLPTEAEWEYVARAGTTTPFWWGSSISTNQANYDGTGTYGGGPKGENRGRTVPVDSFAANPWGLYNVHGNLWEWVQDCWNQGYNGAPSDGSAWTTGDCGKRVVRGGGWAYHPQDLRAAYRFSWDPSSQLRVFGFRVARTLTP